MNKHYPSLSSIIHMVIFFALLLLAASGPALAGTYSGGDGTSGDPYQISTVADLIELSNTSADWGAAFIQTADIAFNSDETLVDWNGDGTADWDADDQKGFSPIGSYIYYTPSDLAPFTGVYDGGGHTIGNLYILREGADPNDYDIYDVGLFGYADGAELKNIGLVNPVVTGTFYAGGLVGWLSSGGSIDNCYAEKGAGGEVSGYMGTGGLAGVNDGSVTNAYTTVKTTGTSTDLVVDAQLGGLVGWNTGAISDCRAAGAVESISGLYVGGLAGENSGTITNSYSTGTVLASDVTNRAGGLVGLNEGTIDACHSTGNIEANHLIGGLVGQNGGYYNGEIRDSYATGEVHGDEVVGGLVGVNGWKNRTGTISGSFAAGSVTGRFDVGGLVGRNGYYNKIEDTTTTSGTGTITNCYAIGNAESSGDDAGGLVGFNVESTITNAYAAGNVTPALLPRGLVSVDFEDQGSVTQSFWDKKTTGADYSDGGTGKTTAELKQPGTFTGWTFDAANWAISDGHSRPYLAWQKVAMDNGYPDSIAAASVTFPQGNIHNNSGAAVQITYGYMYKQNAPPTWEDSTKTQLGTTTVQNTDDLTLPETAIDALTADTAYYARAYADDGNDIWYGQVVRFTTPALYTLTVTNGTGDGDYTAGAVVGIVADVPPEGHSFDAWTGDTGSVDDAGSASTTLTMPAADIQVTAEFRVNQYTVTFRDHDGAALKTETVNHGNSATAPADPARTGYTFTGWDTAFDNVTSDLTVTAQYEINTYTVTFRDHDGDVLKTETVNHGGSATAPADPTRTGYTFTGWDTAFDNVASDLTVTAQYEINTYYTLTYYAGANGIITGTSPQTVIEGGDGSAVTAVADTGYHFVQWSDGLTSNPRTDTHVTTNIAVTAEFAANPVEKGDINNDATLDLADAILALQISVGIDPGQNVYKAADVNGDERIGIEEAIYILQKVVGARQ